MSEWWESGDEVHRLAQWLNNLAAFSNTGDVIYYFEKPWKWTPEYEHMVAHPDADEPLKSDCETCTPPDPEEDA